MDICVISDVHLGTYGCQAKELAKYLKSIDPDTLILNGDIIDIWQFKKRYFPKSHFRVIHLLMKFMSKGKRVVYITGNHDEMLRKFDGETLGNLEICNKLVLEHNNEKLWFFHGDVFDVTMQHSRWIAQLGSIGYDLLILLNSFVNWWCLKLGKEKLSLSKKIKNSVKGAVKFINNFEQIAANIAIENGYDRVICGHIHHPEIKTLSNDKGAVTYMNSGDWVENLSALECVNEEWSVYTFNPDEMGKEEPPVSKVELKNKELFQAMVSEFSKS